MPKIFMLAQVETNYPNDVLTFLIFYRNLYRKSTQKLLHFPEPASRTSDAQKAAPSAPYVFPNELLSWKMTRKMRCKIIQIRGHGNLLKSITYDGSTLGKKMLKK